MDFSQLRSYSFLSQAVYRGLTGLSRGASPEALEEKLTSSDTLGVDNRFAALQAKLLTGSNTVSEASDGFTFIHQRPNTLITGFSGTVFQAKGNGRTVIALRGTEPNLFDAQLLQDVLRADFLGLVLRQKAYGQIADAYRYYRQLTTGSTSNVNYSTSELAELRDLISFHFAGKKFTQLDLSDPFDQNSKLLVENYISDTVSDKGILSAPISANEIVDFTGHSLGGHLAMMLADMVARHQGTQFVGDVITYNAPGQGGFVADLREFFGLGPSWTTPIADRLHHVIGEGGMTAAGTLGCTPERHAHGLTSSNRSCPQRTIP